MTGIVDAGLGNVNSVKNMIDFLGFNAKIVSSPEELETVEKIILPGVGSFDFGVSQLEKLKFIDILKKRVLEDRIPILGICLGMQLLTKESEEGNMEGLGFIEARAVKFDFPIAKKSLPIPHMGWNTITIIRKHPILNGLDDKSRFYFVHSYHVICKNRKDVLTTTCYGYNFVSSFCRKNIYGVQFHPEKSHKFGLILMKNFLEAV